MSEPKEPTVAQIVEFHFWEEVFLAALKNPKVIEIMYETSQATKELIPIQLAALADKALKELRYRTSEREGAIYLEEQLPKWNQQR